MSSLIFGSAFVFLVVMLFPSANASGQATILQNHSSYQTSWCFYVFGEVENTGDTPIDGVKVSATFYNVNNVTIGYASDYTEIDVLLPGRKTPFGIYTSDYGIAQLIANYSLKVSWQECPTGKPQGLRIVSNSSSIDMQGHFRVVGEVQNVGNEGSSWFNVFATFYDWKGTVAYIANDFSFATLEPQETGTFEITVSDANRLALVSSYRVTVESYNYAEIPEFTLQTLVLLLLGSTTPAFLVPKKTRSRQNEAATYFLSFSQYR